MHDDEFLRPRDVAALLKIDEVTLKVWRWRLRRNMAAPALPYVKIGRAVRYRRTEIERWISEQNAKNDSDAIN